MVVFNIINSLQQTQICLVKLLQSLNTFLSNRFTLKSNMQLNLENLYQEQEKNYVGLGYVIKRSNKL